MKLLAAALLVCSIAPSAWAVKPQFFKHTTSADFSSGTLTNLVATGHGDLRLGRKLQPLLPPDVLVGAVQAMAETPDGAIVFGTYPANEVMSLRNGKVEMLAKFGDELITSIAVNAKGTVYAATTGDPAKVYRLGKAGDAPTVVYQQDGVNYVWQIVVSGDTLLLGTGPVAKVIEVSAKGDPRDVATLGGRQVLSLLAADDKTLYAGTGLNGLIYRIDRVTGSAFLLHDAAEADITSLVLDKQGRLLVGTGDDASGDLCVMPEDAPQHAMPATLPSTPLADPKSPEDAPPPVSPIPAGDVAEVAGVPTTLPDLELNLPSASSQPSETTGHGNGNAVYRIDRDGFVTEMHRGPFVVYALAVQDDAVLIATGSEGAVFQLRPDAETPDMLIKTDSAQASALLVGRDNTLYLGLSNQGQIASLSAANTAEGKFLSPVLDAGVASAFGQAQLRGQLPGNTAITFRTRSGNAADPEQGGWSDWSAAAAAKNFVPVTSPSARYLQYELTMSSKDGKASPVVEEVTLAYQKPNLPPKFSSLTVASAEDASQPGAQLIAWEAADANEDALKYTIETRLIDKGGWVELAKDLAASPYLWKARDAADGRYEIRVTATDAADNAINRAKTAQRISEPFLNDHTPPTIGDFETTVKDSSATVKFRVVDRLGTVSAVAYTVDKSSDWQKVLPDDTIADSPEERYAIVLKALARGGHTLTVRATDESGNASFEVISVNVP